MTLKEEIEKIYYDIEECMQDHQLDKEECETCNILCEYSKKEAEETD